MITISHGIDDFMKLSLISYVCYRLARALLRALVFLTLSSFVYISFHFFSFLFFLSFFAFRRSLDTVVCDGRRSSKWHVVNSIHIYPMHSTAGRVYAHTYIYIHNALQMGRGFAQFISV